MPLFRFSFPYFCSLCFPFFNYVAEEFRCLSSTFPKGTHAIVEISIGFLNVLSMKRTEEKKYDSSKFSKLDKQVATVQGLRINKSREAWI